MSTSALALRDNGLVGFFGCEAASEASADDVAPGAPLGFRERVEAFACFGADSDAVHLSGARRHATEGITVLPNVSQRDTIWV
jgi:hypothetical protein